MTIAQPNMSAVDTEIGWASNTSIDMNWIRNNTKDGLTNLGGVNGRAWYQNNMAGNCNVSNCGQCSLANCDFPNGTNCYTVTQCNTVNCANCDSRAWLQGNCNCNCTYNCAPSSVTNINCNCNCTCFIAGSLVLMGDKTWKKIEQIQAGEFVMGVAGPTSVERLHVATLGQNRKLLTFPDNSLTWSEEHCFWGKQNNKEWFWSAGPEAWLKEVALGEVIGLKDNSTLMSGPGFEFATLKGFKSKQIVEVEGANPDTPVFLPITSGSPIIINGHVVAASVNEFGYNYRELNWLKLLENFSDI